MDESYEALQGDVAITETSTQGEAWCFFTYTNGEGSYVKVSVDDYEDIAAGTSSNTVIATRIPSSGDVFKTPRIACPGDDQNYPDADWSVVWENYHS